MEPSKDDSTGLRRVVSAYARDLVRIGLAAQTILSSGGSYMAISSLIESGVELAARLQRGVVVRVVGAPLRRGGGRSRMAVRGQEGASPSGGAEVTLDQAVTEWQDADHSLPALAEADGQPFSLSRMLTTVAAAQRTGFMSLSSATSAVARVVAGTPSAESGSRPLQGDTPFSGTPRADPEPPGVRGETVLWDSRGLALAVAFRAIWSTMLLDLSRAAGQADALVLGSRAGEDAAPWPAGPGVPLMTPPLGPTSHYPLRPSAPEPERVGPQSVGGRGLGADWAGGVVDRPGQNDAALDAWALSASYGVNSLFSAPPFGSGSRLSMAVRALAAARSALPSILSSHEATAPTANESISVVPEQYPSGYPVGDAYEVSRISASLGVVGVPSGVTLSGVRATGFETSRDVVDARPSGVPLEPPPGDWVGVTPTPRTWEDSQPLGSERAVGRRHSGRGDGTEEGATSQIRAVFGERWLASIAAAAGLGATMMGLLTGVVALETGSLSGGVPSAGGSGLARDSDSASLPGGPLVARRGATPAGRFGGHPNSSGTSVAPAGVAEISPTAQGQAPRSVWESVTLLPGILTNGNAYALFGRAVGAHLTGSSHVGVAAGVADVEESGAAVTAATVREVLLAASSWLLGASGSDLSGQGAREVSRSGRSFSDGSGSSSAPESRELTLRSGRGMHRQEGRSPATGSGVPGDVGLVRYPSAPPTIDHLGELASGDMAGTGVARTSGGPGEEHRASRHPVEGEGAASMLEAPASAAWYFPALAAAFAARVPWALKGPASQSPPTRLEPAIRAKTVTEGQGLASLPSAEPGTTAQSQTREGGLQPEPGGVERVFAYYEEAFFGLEPVAGVLSMAASLPRAAQHRAASSPPRPMSVTKRDSASRRLRKSAEGRSRGERNGSELLEGWRSEPEERADNALAENSEGGGSPSVTDLQGQDDRELRRRIERLIEEDLRRHGYQP